MDGRSSYFHYTFEFTCFELCYFVYNELPSLMLAQHSGTH